MAKTVTLADVKVLTVVVDVARKAVTVIYAVLDNTGLSWQQQEATFWFQMPPEQPAYDENGVQIGTTPNPDTWYQLPTTYANNLQQMVIAAYAAIKNKIIGA